MSWRDREYARPMPSSRPGRGGFRVGILGGRSIVTVLIVINVAVYALAMLNRTLESWVYGWGVLQAHAVLKGQLWRLITAQYLHDPAGTTHLILNMLGLHFLGRPLEQMWSPRRFFAIYTLSGLAGNLFFTILASQGWIDPFLRAVGASGCIYGLLGIVAVLFPHSTVYVYFLFPIRIRTAAYIFGAIALWSVVQRGSNYGGEACHLAGLVFGGWWAMRGEAWWQQTQWRLPGWAHRSGRPSARGFTAKIAERRDDEETIDRILKKVYAGGIHSLSESEKQALQQATERQRQRDAAAGRVDRL